MSKDTKHVASRLAIGAFAVFALIAVVFCVGCTSGTKDIERAATHAGVLADRMSDESRAGQAALKLDPPNLEAANRSLELIAQSARDLKIISQNIHEALPKVKDVTPWWATLLGNLFWLGMIAAAAVLAVKFWPVIAVFMAGVKWLEWLIPKPTRIAAERDYELYRDADEPNRDAQRDRILASRMNPYYDAAWRRAERKAKLGAKA